MMIMGSKKSCLRTTLGVGLFSCVSFLNSAAAADLLDECLLMELKRAEDGATVGEVRELCLSQTQPIIKNAKRGAISKRFIRERQTEFDPHVITPHKMNYILPISYTDDINEEAYRAIGGMSENLERSEAKFQLSLKVPLKSSTLFISGDALYFGITLQSWWQVYSDNISKPFRETNYQPEFFYLAPLNWHPFGGNTGFLLGVEHQSNGRTQLLSRSWNRAYGGFLFEKDNFALLLKPWHRFSEDDKEFPLDPDGDDNPDIEDYMGHFELSMAYAWDDYEVNFLGRENFSTNKGYAEVGFTFPISGRLRGYVQYTTGYGESLIDYDHNQQRLGIGIALTNAL